MFFKGRVVFLALSAGLHAVLTLFLFFSDSLFFSRSRTVPIPVSVRALPLSSHQKQPKKKRSVRKQRPVKKKRAETSQKKPRPPKPVKKPSPSQVKEENKPAPEKTAESPSALQNEAEAPQTAEEETAESLSALQGEAAASQAAEEEIQATLSAYAADMAARIRRHWNLPQHLIDKDLYAQVEVELNERGEFVERRLLTSSQNELFDRLVLQAVEKASPFFPPPEEIRRLLKSGIVFGLHSRD